jgi:hypothetical protein
VGTPLLATASSKLPITYTNNSASSCQLLDLGNGRFSIQPRYPLAAVDGLTCTFTANQAGNASFLAASPVSQTITFLRQGTRVNVFPPNTVPTSGAYLLANVSSTEGRVSSATKGISFTTSTPSICTISEYTEEDSRGPRVTIRPKGNGTCAVSISFAGNGDLKPSAASWSFNFAGLDIPAPGSNTAQSITFPELVERSVGRSQPLLAKASSGLQVTYMSMTPAVCLILYPASGPSVQTISGVVDAPEWTCTVRASQAGDDRYAPAVSVDRTFKYVKAPMVLRVENGTNLTGSGPHAIITQVRLADNAAMSGISSLGHLLTAQSLTTNVCRIDSHGLWDRSGGIVNRTYVTALANGTCTLKFDFAGTKDRAATSLTWNATITMPVDTATYVEAQIGGVTVPSSGFTISRASALRGLVTMDISVRAKDSKQAPVVNGGRLSTAGGPLKAMFLTPAVCSLSSASNISGNIFRIVLRLNAEGTCSLQVDFPGVNSMRYFPSVLTWSATVTK